MKHNWKQTLCGMIACGVLLTLGSGCAAFRGSVENATPEETSMLNEKYDYKDLKMLSETVAADLVDQVSAKDPQNPPIFVVMGIQNRTREHIDMKAISDTVRTHMIRSNRTRFINGARRDDLLREQGYQLENCTMETRAAIGKQLGAGYMLTGSLISIGAESGRQVRVSKKKDAYYQMTVEVTDLETGLIVATTQKERLRRASKPLIGW